MFNVLKAIDINLVKRTRVSSPLVCYTNKKYFSHETLKRFYKNVNDFHSLKQLYCNIVLLISPY